MLSETENKNLVELLSKFYREEALSLLKTGIMTDKLCLSIKPIFIQQFDKRCHTFMMNTYLALEPIVLAIDDEGYKNMKGYILRDRLIISNTQDIYGSVLGKNVEFIVGRECHFTVIRQLRRLTYLMTRAFEKEVAAWTS